MKEWVIRFRVIAPSDQCTPLFRLPIESTIMMAETADEAWEQWVTAPYASPINWYRKEEIYEA